MGAPGMHRGDPDYFPLYVGNHVLGDGGLVSRLHNEVREKRGLSYSVNSYFSPMEQDGPYLLSLQTRNDQVDEALSVMRDTLQKFLDKGPTEDELVASKKNITGGFPLRIASNSNILDYLNVIGFYDLPLDYLEVFNDRVMAVTREQIVDAFQRRVKPETMTTIIVGGDG
jgi:zinc protease